MRVHCPPCGVQSEYLTKCSSNCLSLSALDSGRGQREHDAISEREITDNLMFPLLWSSQCVCTAHPVKYSQSVSQSVLGIDMVSQSSVPVRSTGAASEGVWRKTHALAVGARLFNDHTHIRNGATTRAECGKNARANPPNDGPPVWPVDECGR